MPVRTPSKAEGPFALFDVHGTMIIDENVVFELLEHQIKKKFIKNPEKVLAAAETAKQQLSGSGYERAGTNFFSAHAQSLAGQPKQPIATHARKFYEENQDRLILPHTRPILEELRRRKYHIALASAGSSIEIDAVADLLEVKESYSTKYESTIDPRTNIEILTGRLASGFLSSAKKGGIARGMVQKYGYPGSLAGGNRKEGDIGPLYAVEGGFCVMPNDELMEIAGWCGLMIISEKQAMADEVPEPVLTWLDEHNPSTPVTQ